MRHPILKAKLTITFALLLQPTPMVSAAIVVRDTSDLGIFFRGFGTFPPIPLDLNLDGIPDAEWALTGSSASIITDNAGVELVIVPDPPPNLGGSPAALPEGYSIGQTLADQTYSVGSGLPPMNFEHEFFTSEPRPNGTHVNVVQTCLSTGCTGWFRGQDGFIGFSFEEDDGTHYGYLQFRGTGGPSTLHLPGGELVSIGYETVAGRAILTQAIPEPSSLFLLGLVCTPALVMRRRVSPK